VRYAPNGDFFVSGGAEGKVCVASLCFHYNYCLCICFDIIRRCVLHLCAFITITVCAYVLTLLEGVSCSFVLSLQLLFVHVLTLLEGVSCIFVLSIFVLSLQLVFVHMF